MRPQSRKLSHRSDRTTTGRPAFDNAAYALLFQPLGFIISTTLLMVPIAMIFGAKWWQGLLTGGIIAIFSYLLFDRVLAVVLPSGLLGGLI